MNLTDLPFDVLRRIAHLASRPTEKLVFTCEVEVEVAATIHAHVASERLFMDIGWYADGDFRVPCDCRAGDRVYVGDEGLEVGNTWGAHAGTAEDLCMPTALWSVNRYFDGNRLYTPGVRLPPQTTMLMARDRIAVTVTVRRAQCPS